MLADLLAEFDGGGQTSGAPLSQVSIRVSVDVLEHLMTLVSELVLTRNQLLQLTRGHDDGALSAPMQRLSHITSDLQEGVMQTRMQPIGNAWTQLPRLVRDLGIETGKRVELVTQGAETELDRQILELIKDPLTHIVRNCVDHGLEEPAVRLAAGKSETGRITLKAYHEGGQIVIVVTDDGRGLDTGKVRVKALADKLATAAEIEALSDQQIMQFIFRPGFSTADQVTNLSGRGVGMDVVRSNIERIGGAIDLGSVAGRGMSFTIKIPLTLAIISVLIVGAAGERFAFPQLAVRELVRVSPRSENRIEWVHDAPVLRLRDHLLPLVSLRRLLELDKSDGGQDELFVVVVQLGADQFGIIVDQVFDTEEIVVKPVSPILRDLPIYSGNAILGDGGVVMILDPSGIAVAAGQGRFGLGEVGEPAPDETDDERGKMSFLLFRAGSEERKAVPLALVARLEKIDVAQIERVHGGHVVQYRDRLMPLVPFEPGYRWPAEGRLSVLVFTEADRSVALVVDQIIDIVEDHMAVEFSSAMPGLIGSAVIAGRATDIIDVGHYLDQGLPGRSGATAEPPAAAARDILMVDDSALFRNLLAPVLSVAGWRVTAVASAREALTLRDAGRRFDVVISDIEMPEMDGLALVAALRADPRWKDTPCVALATRAGRDDIAEALRAGFDTYVTKSNRDALLNTLAGLFAGLPRDDTSSTGAGRGQADGLRAAG
jgi:two-component system chemotaxis sensor kinase CheA